MRKSTYVSKIDKKWPAQDHDLTIVALGYEGRARFIAEFLSRSRRSDKGKLGTQIAVSFESQHEGDYSINLEWFEKNDFEVIDSTDNDYRRTVLEIVRRSVENSDSSVLRVLIDISSLSRLRLATLLDIFVSDFPDTIFQVDFVYALAKYTPPSSSLVPNSHVGPVLKSNFTGWWDEPDRATSAIVGLGYEPDKALGAVEYLDPAEVWTFTPQSAIGEYTGALALANSALLENVRPDHQFTYIVHEPMDCFLTLESLVYGVMQKRNPILLPFGPKLFALCCLLVGCVHPSVAVWRVSAQGAEPAVIRQGESDDMIYGLAARFAPAFPVIP